MKKRIMILLLASAALTSVTHAAPAAPLPPEQWTPEAELWLARAMVAEAGWSTTDHAAIAWVLHRRWSAHAASYPSWTFVQQVRAYCAGLRGEPKSVRMKWVHSLLPDGSKPLDWPAHVTWNNGYELAWKRVLRTARAFGQGELRDPCTGNADHWGGVMDSKPQWAVPVNCGYTANIFYRVKR